MPDALPLTAFPARLARAAGRVLLAWWRVLDLGAVVAVLLLSPSSYGRAARTRLARQLYVDTLPILPGFTLLAALLSLVITHIVVVTAHSYGLTRYALEMVIRVLVLELIPLTAALFVALRTTIPAGEQLARLRAGGHWQQWRAQGGDPLRMEVLPRVAAGVYACVTLAALSCAVALTMAYLGVYGLNTAGLPAFTRMFGQVFTPAITLVFAFKTACFALAVALVPIAASLRPQTGTLADVQAGRSALARLFALLLVVEVVSLMGNYY